MRKRCEIVIAAEGKRSTINDIVFRDVTRNLRARKQSHRKQGGSCRIYNMNNP